MTEDKKQAGKKGGVARRESMTPEQLKAQAQRAAARRWGKPMVATHKGTFLDEFGVDMECYVLDDATHTPVLSQTGMGRAIGLVGRGNALPRFLASQAMDGMVGAELREKLENPLIFQWRAPGADQGTVTKIFGSDATVLIDLCRAILQAEVAGRFKPQQKKIATQAAIIIGASAKSGIRNLVYALAGYDVTRQQIIEAFKAYVQEEAKKYEQEFPPELYAEWHRLYQIPVLPKGRSWHFKHLTVRHIYYPLAMSNGKILELLRALKAHDGDRQKKLFQFLNEVGARALRMQLGRVLEMAQDSQEPHQYEGRIAARFGGQQELELEPPQPAA